MNRARLSQIIGGFGLALTLVGAALSAVATDQTWLANGALIVGAALLAAYLSLNFHAIRGFFTKRSSRYGANMAVVIILFTGAIVIVQAVSIRHSRRYDLTRNQRFTLAAQTINVLASLERELEMFGFFQPGTEEQLRAEDLINQYAHRSSRVRYELIDPDRKPQRVADMGVTQYGTLVVQYGERRELLTSLTEERLTNAILRLTRDTAKTIYFVTGHGEKDIESEAEFGYSILKDAAEAQNYIVKTVSIFDEADVPEDCSLLIVAGPRKDYFGSEIDKISRYLAEGRNALFLLDAREDFPAIAELLARYRILLDDDVLIDPYSRVFGGDYTVPVVTQYENHPITRGFNVATFFPMARSVRIAPEEIEGVEATVLAKTGKSAWGETDLDLVRRGQAVRSEGDFRPPLAVAAISSKRFDNGEPAKAGFDESQIVVIGDSDFADNSSFRISGNGDFILNVINYLAEEKDLIAIRPKEGLGDRLFLTASQGRLLLLVSIILLPLSVISVGFTVFMRKRRRG